MRCSGLAFFRAYCHCEIWSSVLRRCWAFRLSKIWHCIIGCEVLDVSWTMILQNVGKHPPSGTSSHLRKPESVLTLNLQRLFIVTLWVLSLTPPLCTFQTSSSAECFINMLLSILRPLFFRSQELWIYIFWYSSRFLQKYMLSLQALKVCSSQVPICDLSTQGESL